MSPGPGSYLSHSDMPDLSDLDTDTLISLNELRNILSSESSLDAQFIMDNAINLKKLHNVISNLSKAKAAPEGPRFPKSERFQTKSHVSPGPAHYSPPPPDKERSTVIMKTDDQIRIPASILNNPIHEVRPLVVNLYYKKPNPAVGAYDATLPSEISKVVEDQSRLNYKSVFESKRQR